MLLFVVNSQRTKMVHFWGHCGVGSTSCCDAAYFNALPLLPAVDTAPVEISKQVKSAYGAVFSGAVSVSPSALSPATMPSIIGSPSLPLSGNHLVRSKKISPGVLWPRFLIWLARKL